MQRKHKWWRINLGIRAYIESKVQAWVDELRFQVDECWEFLWDNYLEELWENFCEIMTNFWNIFWNNYYVEQIWDIIWNILVNCWETFYFVIQEYIIGEWNLFIRLRNFIYRQFCWYCDKFFVPGSKQYYLRNRFYNKKAKVRRWIYDNLALEMGNDGHQIFLSLLYYGSFTQLVLFIVKWMVYTLINFFFLLKDALFPSKESKLIEQHNAWVKSIQQRVERAKQQYHSEFTAPEEEQKQEDYPSPTDEELGEYLQTHKDVIDAYFKHAEEMRQKSESAEDSSYNDVPLDGQFGFQDPATSVMEGIIELHNDIFFFLIIILVLVFWMMFKILLHYSQQFNKFFFKTNMNIVSFLKKKFFYDVFLVLLVKKNLLSQRITHNALLETIWVILPAIVLVLIAIPSFDILYSMDEIFNADFLIKVVGNQWYWTYEIPEYKIASNKTIATESFDAIMTAPETIIYNRFTKTPFRLLDTDVWLCLPANVHIQAIVTSEDVIHSWAIPALGIKIDCVPGRLNQVCLYIKRSGVYYGQCSEICGINHGFMPIKIEALSPYQWIIKSIEGSNDQWTKVISALIKK